MNFESDPAKVIQDDGHREGSGEADTCKNTGAEPLRQHQARDSRSDADETAHPGPPGGRSHLLSTGPGLANNQLDEEHAHESRDVNPKGGKHRLSEGLSKFGIGARLTGVRGARGNRG